MGYNENGNTSFWTTLPGILSAIAALITAIVSLYIFINSGGIGGGGEMGSISVTSSPDGSSIYLDGSHKGTTSMTITDIAEGSHTITLKHTDYQDWSQTIQVYAGKTKYVSAVLISINGGGNGGGEPTTTQMHPSSDIITATTPKLTVPTPTSKLAVSPDPISFSLNRMNEGETDYQTFRIYNDAEGTLEWSVSANQPWITVSPAYGTDAGTVRIDVNTKGLSGGSHYGTITIESNGGTKTIPLSFSLSIPSQLDSFSNFWIISETDDEIEFTVDYRYYSDYGNDVGVGVKPLSEGKESYWFGNSGTSSGYLPQIETGNGQGTVSQRVSFCANNPPDSLTTDQIELSMWSIDSGTTFYSKTFRYTKTWYLTS